MVDTFKTTTVNEVIELLASKGMTYREARDVLYEAGGMLGAALCRPIKGHEGLPLREIISRS